MKGTVSVLLLSVAVLLSSCYDPFVDADIGGEEVFIVSVSQVDEVFTLNVGVDQFTYDHMTSDADLEAEELFVWLRPDFGMNDTYGESRDFFPVARRPFELSSLRLAPVDPDNPSAGYNGGVDVLVDFTEIVRRNRIWSLSPDRLDGQNNDDLVGFDLIVSSGFASGWASLNIGPEFAYFPNSYPRGDFRSGLETVDFSQDGFQPFVLATGQAGLWVSHQFATDGDVVTVRLQTEQNTRLISDTDNGGFETVQDPQITAGPGLPLTLSYSSIDTSLSSPVDGTYVWSVLIDGQSGLNPGPHQVALSPSGSTGLIYMQVTGWPSQWWSESIDVKYIYLDYASDTYAYTGFDSLSTNVNVSAPDVASVYTELITYPFEYMPLASDHNWHIDVPVPSSHYDTSTDSSLNKVLGTGDGSIDEPYAALRNDIWEMPVQDANYSTIGLGRDLWLVANVRTDTSDSWEDRVEIELGYYDQPSDSYSFWQQESLRGPLEWSQHSDPLLTNGWTQIGRNLGSIADGAIIRFRLKTDNIFDGRDGVYVDNVRLVFRPN